MYKNKDHTLTSIEVSTFLSENNETTNINICLKKKKEFDSYLQGKASPSILLPVPGFTVVVTGQGDLARQDLDKRS